MSVKLTVERVRSLLDVPEKRQKLADELSELHTTEVVELFAQLIERERISVFRLLSTTQAEEVFKKLPPQQQLWIFTKA